MKVTPISDPLAGERVVGVKPDMEPSVDAKWRRRLNLYTGRALSDTALTTEQVGRAGRLATRGQMVSPGVTSGLVVALERPPAKRSLLAIRAGGDGGNGAEAEAEAAAGEGAELSARASLRKDPHALR